MKTDQELCPWLPDALAELQEQLIQSVQDMPGGYRHSVETLLSAGGKRLRPRLVLLCGKLGTPDMDKLIRMAAGIELLHTATLIHDDMIDGAETRRGVPSLQSVFSARQAVLSGDFLLAKSMLLLHTVLGGGSSGDFLRGILHICKSELLQHASRYSVRVSYRNYYRRIAGKTAALFALSCYCGGMESGLTGPHIENLRRYGYNLGMAFQITDDILDITGNARILKKPASQDIRQGIYTLPLLLAMDRDPSAAATVSRYGKHRRSLPAAKLTRILNRTHAVEEAYEEADLRLKRGLAALENLPESAERTCLEQLITSLSARRF
ncbi:MAG: polyprenyl synthetase family protein [Spirochaetales bacterium]|nr:polyprenyl synthetase family protein [Spirochaetales bacterium]